MNLIEPIVNRYTLKCRDFSLAFKAGLSCVNIITMNQMRFIILITECNGPLCTDTKNYIGKADTNKIYWYHQGIISKWKGNGVWDDAQPIFPKIYEWLDTDLEG